jgi:hypothetical protein
MIVSMAQRWRMLHVRQPTPAAVCSTKADVLLGASDGDGGLGWQLQK